MILGFQALPCSCGTSSSDVGEGTEYPISFTFDEMVSFFWSVKEYTTTGSATWGATGCDECGVTAGASVGSGDQQLIRTGSDAMYTQAELLCNPVGSFDWSPDMESDNEDDGSATLQATVDLCNVRYDGNYYWPYMSLNFSGTLTTPSASSASDSYSTESPPEVGCPGITVASNWASYSSEMPPEAGTWTVGFRTIPLYVVPTPSEEGSDDEEEDSDCDIESPTLVTVDWQEASTYTTS